MTKDGMNRRQWIRAAMAAGGLLLPTAVGAVPGPSRSLWDHDFSDVERRIRLDPDPSFDIVLGPLFRYSGWGYGSNLIYAPTRNGKLLRGQMEDLHRSVLQHHPQVTVEIEIGRGRFVPADIERGLLLGPVVVR